jgi:hypothetical protein
MLADSPPVLLFLRATTHVIVGDHPRPLLVLILQLPDHPACECPTEVLPDDPLEAGAGDLGVEHVDEGLELEGETVQVVQQVVDEGGAVQGVQACPVELRVVAALARRQIDLQVGEVQEGVEDEVAQELVVVPTVLQIQVRPLISHEGD